MPDTQLDTQLSAHGDIAVAQLLTMAAMSYVGKIVTATIGPPTPSMDLPLAIDRACKLSTAWGALPDLVAAALQDLQGAAALFTVHWAASCALADPDRLQQLEDALLSTLLSQAPQHVLRLHVHDDYRAARYLSDRAIYYARQVIHAEDTRAPLGSADVQRALTDLQAAAVAFVVQFAISKGLGDAKALRPIERQIIGRLSQEIA